MTQAHLFCFGTRLNEFEPKFRTMKLLSILYSIHAVMSKSNIMCMEITLGKAIQFCIYFHHQNSMTSLFLIPSSKIEYVYTYMSSSSSFQKQISELPLLLFEFLVWKSGILSWSIIEEPTYVKEKGPTPKIKDGLGCPKIQELRNTFQKTYAFWEETDLSGPNPSLNTKNFLHSKQMRASSVTILGGR